ncbi:MAG: c-type cytochrome [Planctomycetales bacterium]|nr:c-type cytochrome [Planctomycetales bacterium]
MLLTALSVRLIQSAETDGIEVPLGLKPIPASKSNPWSVDKAELGKQLYFDTRLSVDNTVSCASCHAPDKGWSNGESNAQGVDGQRGGRNSPTILNAAYHKMQFWDGRASSLEDQALGPIANPIEMNLPVEQAVEKIGKIKGYQEQFQAVFGEPVSAENLAKAIAAFERTVLAGNSPYDRFKAGDQSALSEQAQAGMKLFFGKANCSGCHSGANFTDNGFHNLGVNFHAESPDLGREIISQIEGDRGAFKTPSLRDIARTGPYMHDGSVKTLEEVVEYYNKGGTTNDYLDEEIFPLKLNPEQVTSIVVFLKEGLTSDDYPTVKPPKLPE